MGGRSWRQTLRVILPPVLLFSLTLPAVTPRFYASDEVEFYAWLRSLAFDHDADFENEYRYFYDAGPMRNPGFHATFLEETNEAGRRQNFTPIGTALLWSPFFAAGHVVALATGQPADGFSQPYITAVAVGSALYGGLALVLAWRCVRRVVNGGLPSTLVTWLGTPIVFYMYVAPGFSHAASAFAVGLFLWTWLQIRDRWSVSGAFALGLAGALMAMVREQDAFFIAGPVLDYARWFLRGRRDTATPPTLPRAAKAAAAGAAAFVLGYAPQLAAYSALNGRLGPPEAVARKMFWTSPHFLQVLFSPEHGLFIWTPLALVGVLGLVWLVAARTTTPEARWVGAVVLVMFLLQVYVSGSVESWTVAGSFGQRRFVAVTPLLAIGVAHLSRRALTADGAAAFKAWAAVVVLCVWWNLGLMAQFGLHLMDRQRLSPIDNARTTFVELPLRAPSIVWRYLTDRESLFGLPRQ